MGEAGVSHSSLGEGRPPAQRSHVGSYQVGSSIVLPALVQWPLSSRGGLLGSGPSRTGGPPLRGGVASDLLEGWALAGPCPARPGGTPRWVVGDATPALGGFERLLV